MQRDHNVTCAKHMFLVNLIISLLCSVHSTRSTLIQSVVCPLFAWSVFAYRAFSVRILYTVCLSFFCVSFFAPSAFIYLAFSIRLPCVQHLFYICIETKRNGDFLWLLLFMTTVVPCIVCCYAMQANLGLHLSEAYVGSGGPKFWKLEQYRVFVQLWEKFLVFWVTNAAFG